MLHSAVAQTFRTEPGLRTCHVVVHPVEHDLRGSVPPGGYVACHLVVRVPCQTKVQDLRDEGVFYRGRESKMR